MLHTHIRRTLFILTAGTLLTAPAVLLMGCGEHKAESPAAAQQTPAHSIDERRAALTPYMEATTAYNSSMLPLSLAVSTTINDLRQGKHPTSIILPPLSKLSRALNAAHDVPEVKGVYPDVDAAADDLHTILKELAPLADQMENYYAAKAYTTDGCAQADEMTAQFLPLYDRFISAYDRLDAIVTDHYKEMRLTQIDAMHSDGRENAATFLELRTKARELVHMLRSGGHDPEATEAKIREINTLIEKLPAGTGYLVTYKNGINSLVTAVRAYSAGPPDPNKLSNVVEEFNRLAATGNNVDVNALDAKKK